MKRVMSNLQSPVPQLGYGPKNILASNKHG